MIRTIKIGDITLIHGDARTAAASLGRNFAHMGMTDAPYHLTSGGKDSGHLSGKFHGEYANNGKIVRCDISWPEIMDILGGAIMPGRDVISMTDDKNLSKAEAAALEAGLRYHGLLTWHKKQGTPSRWYMKTAEHAQYFYRPKPGSQPRTINNPGDGRVIAVRPVSETKHPTEKPVMLMRHWIENSTDLGELVFDPFMGVGSTALAALQSGRSFIGVEIEERWFEIAVDRVRRAYDGGQIELLGGTYG